MIVNKIVSQSQATTSLVVIYKISTKANTAANADKMADKMKKRSTNSSKTLALKSSKLAKGRATVDRNGTRESKSKPTQESIRASVYHPVPQLPADYFLSTGQSLHI